jgi:nucleoid-associated protein YgaU
MGTSSRVFVLSLAALAIIGIGPVSVAENASPPVRVPAAVGGGDGTEPEALTVVVERGDHFWKISARRLTDVLGRAPQSPEIGPYWREVVVANHDRIRSGDPDLIFPGEVIELPALPDGRQLEDSSFGGAGSTP